MKLKLFKTMWGHPGDFASAVSACRQSGWEGIEGPPPSDALARRELRAQLLGEGLEYIAEVSTAVPAPGIYLPEREASIEEHLQSFREGAERATECGALFVSSMAGCDAWSCEQSVQFFGATDDVAREVGIVASFETHRGRSFYSPWVTRNILRQLPDLKLTCDFSHWCVVCERLIDTEPQVLEVCFAHAHHIHARVGYDQGPQVPDPSAPEHAHDLHAHERWWSAIWDAHEAKGHSITTMTPEFGPDGYLHQLPHTRMPVADLQGVNAWMARRQRERFEARPST
jgi:sugar phosphate isomerase/epimerase